MLAVAYSTGSASLARQVNADNQDKKGYLGPPGWGFGVRLTTPPHKKIVVMKPQENEAGRMSWQRHESICKTLWIRIQNKLKFYIGNWNVRPLFRA